MTDIIQVRGTREQKIAAAKIIKAEFEETFPEMAALRRQLIDAGMCADNLSSVASVVTEKIDFRVWRDDPNHYRRLHALPPILTKEIQDAVQARTSKPTVPANTVYDSRGRVRRR
jgi:hypothetical protein